MGTLEGKVALITGGASGIGLATARRLRVEGADVVIADLAEREGEKAAAETGASFVRADVSSSQDWRRVIDTVHELHEGLDLAHLNAGVTTPEATIDDVTDEQYRRIMGANLDGVVLGMRAVVPAIAARGGGSIVATASLAGLIGFSPDPIYGATKAAVVGLVRALAPQLAARGITVNAICPGMTDTAIVSEEARALLSAANFPLMTPEEIAEVVYQRLVGSESGQAWVCQVGREATPYRFAGVPGPGGAVAGRPPPPGIAADEQLRRVRHE
jgi:NAD(P)-dependent dehydrogenase (short-subunit alcohol dehydrogenase family)